MDFDVLVRDISTEGLLHTVDGVTFALKKKKKSGVASHLLVVIQGHNSRGRSPSCAAKPALDDINVERFGVFTITLSDSLAAWK